MAIVNEQCLFASEFLNNSNHISLDGVSGSQFGQLQAFGWTCGGQRGGGTLGPDGIVVNKWTQAILVFGCHFEDLVHGIIYSGGVIDPGGGNSDASIAVFGSTFHLMRPGSVIDTNATSAYIAAFVSSGNNLGPRSNTSQFYNLPRVKQGVLIGGNTRNNNTTQSYPARGYIEHIPSTDKNAYRMTPLTTSERPAANAMPVGTVIFNTTTKKINISDGANWRDANGNIV